MMASYAPFSYRTSLDKRHATYSAAFDCSAGCSRRLDKEWHNVLSLQRCCNPESWGLVGSAFRERSLKKM